MRWGVKTPLYKLRKSFEEALDRYVPSLGWQTQYSRVSFSTQRYSEVIRATQQQGKLLGLGLGSVGVMAMAAVGVLVWKAPGPLVQRVLRGLSGAWVRISKNTVYSV